MSDYFIALDVETANASRASICQIGMVAYAGNTELWRWESLVDPQEDFEGDAYHAKMHGIGPGEVLSAPDFRGVLQTISGTMASQVIVAWGDFDQDAIHQAATKYALETPNVFWLDACRVARVVWPNLESYKLSAMADLFGIIYTAHQALPDAETCAKVLLAALEASGTDLRFWLDKFGQRIATSYDGPKPVNYPVRANPAGREDGPLRGHVAVFTGDFAGGKGKIEQIACGLGCDVKTGYSKNITMCVVGNRDPSAFGGTEKSTKHLQAEQAQSEGRSISILTEREFLKIATSHGITVA